MQTGTLLQIIFEYFAALNAMRITNYEELTAYLAQKKWSYSSAELLDHGLKGFVWRVIDEHGEYDQMQNILIWPLLGTRGLLP